MTYRPLTESEIHELNNQGCICADWNKVQVETGFSSKYIYQTRFEGEVKIGRLDGAEVEANGMSRSSGIYFCTIKNCVISGDVYFSKVGLMEGYSIDNQVIIENVNSMIVDGPTKFGNGTVIEVLNEGGGREVPIFDKLSAQTAYLLANYQYEPEMIKQITSLIVAYCDTKESERGMIDSGSYLSNTGSIRNVNFGPGSRIDGALLLENGTVASSISDPCVIGHGVTAKNFVILSGSKVDSGSIADKCFIGQGVKMGKQFSAENSAFFANSEAFHGEAVSLFAGPYTVTHHKSTLLIATSLSFFNAGSGTNQSNHMYKLGPLHQGVIERGSKTGSFSYLLWPCKVGPFSVVMDKHGSNFDTSEFPFSYVNIENGKSTLTPAMNLFTVGTKRDSEKWPARDRRKDPIKVDLIHFDLFNPFLVGKIVAGIQVLGELYEKTSRETKSVHYKGITIPRLLLKTGRKYYILALKKYYGDMLLQRLGDKSYADLSEIRNTLKTVADRKEEYWADVAGMLAPISQIRSLITDLKEGNIAHIDALNRRFEQIYAGYDDWAYGYFTHTLENQMGIDLADITIEQLSHLLQDWETNSLKLNNMILRDAMKEFDQNSKVCFGIDGDEESREADFLAVRGTYEGNKFIQGLHAENESIKQISAKWQETLSNLGR